MKSAVCIHTDAFTRKSNFTQTYYYQKWGRYVVDQFPLDKLSSVLADTGQIPDSLSHLGPFKEDVSSIVLIKKNMSPLLSVAFNHLISYQNVVFSLPVGISALGKSI